MGNIIGNKAFVGNYEAEKIYQGDTLVYEKGLLFSMPSYNNTVPYVNSFGAVTFTGCEDVDGWIGHDPDGANKQFINIIPYSGSLGNKFLMTISAKWIPPSSSSSGSWVGVLFANSDNVDSNGINQTIGIQLGMNNNRDAARFAKNTEQYMIHVLSGANHFFSLGCYVDTLLKRCYMGLYSKRSMDVELSDKLDIPDVSNNYLEYSNSINFDLLISSTFGKMLPVNSIKDIKIRKVSNVDIKTGKITYL